MDKQIKQLINKLKKITITEREMIFIRSNLSSFIFSSPMASTPSPYLFKSHFLTLRKSLIAACLIVIFGGGALAFAAEKSLPGDILHPIKININEKIISALQFSPEAKIAWHKKIVDRRLAEIQALSLTGKLDKTKKAQMGDELKNNLDAISKINNSVNINTESTTQKINSVLLKLDKPEIENETKKIIEDKPESNKNPKDKIEGNKELDD